MQGHGFRRARLAQSLPLNCKALPDGKGVKATRWLVRIVYAARSCCPRPLADTKLQYRASSRARILPLPESHAHTAWLSSSGTIRGPTPSPYCPLSLGRIPTSNSDAQGSKGEMSTFGNRSRRVAGDFDATCAVRAAFSSSCYFPSPAGYRCEPTASLPSAATWASLRCSCP
ncbi:hypothetical protein BCV69DRAFT_284814 [Microstroma glucosiphilum]|uniref:Uncharacterized protein n=1 Tax=Pseudomicrostroma glucosiphilum TaxID=1684307 RepID=A0A316U2Y0_9BASI|nr:hypothetical protein BCV69DRAFT_284814 [Pseudomicrostroma glucosiphilum]PWN18841.1 hypothetical protein BCV69DRAFT_284814 [Pseudomicrostroma glucosiphilum]